MRYLYDLLSANDILLLSFFWQITALPQKFKLGVGQLLPSTSYQIMVQTRLKHFLHKCVSAISNVICGLTEVSSLSLQQIFHPTLCMIQTPCSRIRTARHWATTCFCLCVISGCFHATVGELNSFKEAVQPLSIKRLLSAPLQIKSAEPCCLLPFHLASDNQNCMQGFG